MSDRTLDNRTFKSKRLAALSILAYGLFPYIFQQTDDHGCLDTDPELIKAQRFPRIKWIDEELIGLCIKEYNEVGMLFLWEQDGSHYGFFVRFEAKSGRYLSKRRNRQTPEPPADKLAKFLKDTDHFPIIPDVPNCSYKLSQVKLSIIIKKELKEIPSPSADFVDKSVEKSKSETPKQKQNRRIDTIIDFVKKIWGEDISPSQIQVLVYGLKREGGKAGFRTYETLWRFIQGNADRKPTQGIFEYLRACSQDDQTVKIWADKAWRQKDPETLGDVMTECMQRSKQKEA